MSKQDRFNIKMKTYLKTTPEHSWSHGHDKVSIFLRLWCKHCRVLVGLNKHWERDSNGRVIFGVLCRSLSPSTCKVFMTVPAHDCRGLTFSQTPMSIRYSSGVACNKQSVPGSGFMAHVKYTSRVLPLHSR